MALKMADIVAWARCAVLCAGVILAGGGRSGLCAVDVAAGNSSYNPQHFLSLDAMLYGGSLLDRFKAREILLGMSYDDLAGLRGHFQEWGLSASFQAYWQEALRLQEVEGIFILQENIALGLRPDHAPFPFTPGTSPQRTITALDPQADQFYFDNLALSDKGDDLVEVDPTVWVSSAKNMRSQAMPKALDAGKVAPTGFPDVFKKLWSLPVESDRIIGFPYTLRQWRKSYPESFFDPEIYQGAALWRNNYRLFAKDLVTGKALWSFSAGDAHGQEFYQTFPSPDARPLGYGLLVEQGAVYTQLNDALVRVDLNDIVDPKLAWSRPLGEYALATKPVMAGGAIVVMLMNARMELWACGFRMSDGVLLWSDYVGISSFWSAAGSISRVEGDVVFLGTNHGILVALDARQGKIVWIKKYRPRAYSLVYYLYRITMKGLFNRPNIPFDTQALELGNDGLLYYKPRESDVLYVLDHLTGAERKKILVDSHKYYFLRARDGKAAFLSKDERTARVTGVHVISLDDGKALFSKAIEGDMLRGAKYLDDDALLFKEGARVHWLRLADNGMGVKDVLLDDDGWLLAGSSATTLFLGKGRTISCFDAGGRVANEKIARQLNVEENFWMDLGHVARTGFVAGQEEADVERLLDLLRQVNVSAQDLVGVFEANIERISGKGWKRFWQEVDQRSGHAWVDYQGVKVRLKNFLMGKGVLEQGGGVSPATLPTRLGGARNLKVEGAQIYLLPVKVVRGKALRPYFFMWNSDQLLCVHESGKILWQRRMYYRPNAQADGRFNYNDDQHSRRLLADDVEAFLQDDVLIVNDRVNVVAMNAVDGAFLWSATNADEDIPREDFIKNKSRLFKGYGVQAAFVKNAMYQVLMLNGVVYLVHKDRISLLDPQTGFCRKSMDIGAGGIVEAASANGKVYLLSLKMDKLFVIGADLGRIQEFPLGFVDQKVGFSRLLFLGDKVLLRVNEHVYVLSDVDGSLLQRISFSGADSLRIGLDVIDNLLLVTRPLQRAEAYGWNGVSMERVWSVLLNDTPTRAIWPFPFPKSVNAVVENGAVYVPARINGRFGLMKLDARTGRQEWMSEIEQFGGLFYNLSNAVFRGGRMYFIYSLTSNMAPVTEEILPKIDRISVETRFIGLDVGSGRDQVAEKLPTTIAGWEARIYGFEPPGVVQTNGSVLSAVHGKLLNGRKKE